MLQVPDRIMPPILILIFLPLYSRLTSAPSWPSDVYASTGSLYNRCNLKHYVVYIGCVNHFNRYVPILISRIFDIFYYYFDFTNFFSTVAAAGSTGNKIILLSNKGQGITASKPGGGPPSIGKKNKNCTLISRIFLFKNY